MTMTALALMKRTAEANSARELAEVARSLEVGGRVDTPIGPVPPALGVLVSLLADAIDPPGPKTMKVSWHPEAIRRALDRLVAIRDEPLDLNRLTTADRVGRETLSVAISTLRAALDEVEP